MLGRVTKIASIIQLCFLQNIPTSLAGILGGVNIPDVNGLLTPVMADAMVTAIGISMDHRSYEPATSMDTGLSFGIESTLVQPSSALGTFIGTITNSNTPTTVPILPSLKFHFHKGLSRGVDVGISFLPPLSSIPYIGKSFLIGGDLKIILWAPEEGLTWAIRGSYNLNSLTVDEGALSLSMKTATVSPQLLISKKLTFADPYLGVGFQYTYGSAQLTLDPSEFNLPANIPTISPISITQNGIGINTFFFMGICLRIPSLAFMLTLEGAYSPYGMNYLGTKVGFGF